MRLLLVLAFSLLLTAAPRAEASHGSQHVFVTINGLVCDFCARAMEKVFLKKESVASVKVDLTTKIVTLDLKPDAKIDDAEITSGVTDAGYAVVTINRD